MPRYRITVNILEIGREVEVEAPSKGEALARARRGEWDTEKGATDPERYIVSTHRGARELTP